MLSYYVIFALATGITYVIRMVPVYHWIFVRKEESHILTLTLVATITGLLVSTILAPFTFVTMIFRFKEHRANVVNNFIKES
jgi:hypothetical protein